MNFWEVIDAINKGEFAKLTPEDLGPLPEEKLDTPLKMRFGTFLDGKYQEGKHNLYIIWKGKQALYVGIAKDNIWIRWFNAGYSHMYFAQKYSGTREGGTWVGSSTIGRVIQKNFPKSLKWIVELRHYSTFGWTDNEKLEAAEQRLIRELRPLFNVTYRSALTEQEARLAERLEYGHSF